MQIETPQDNVVLVYIGGTHVRRARLMFSYQTLVAVFISRVGVLVIDESPTSTTSRHLSKQGYGKGGKDVHRVPARVLQAMADSIGFDKHAFVAGIAPVLAELPEDVQVGLDALLEEND